MLSLVERVYRTILRYDLFPAGARALVAVSGGADSTALAHVLHELAPRAGFSLAALAHVNHRLRGAASDADEAFCREMGEGLGLPVVISAVDAAVEARRLRTSVEDAGRRLRYAFFAASAERLGASHVALAHTLDDQAETVLLALIRGAGPRGLAGIRVRRGPVVRPLLGERHGDLAGWLTSRGVPYREDESNRDGRYLRNRVRHELLPLLRDRFSPGIVTMLSRTAAIWDADASFLDDVAAGELARISRKTGEGLVLDRHALAVSPPAVGRRVARLAMAQVGGEGCFVGFDEAERLLELAARTREGRLALPGQHAEARGGEILLTRSPDRSGDVASPAVNFSGALLSIPGEVCFPGTRLVVTAERQPGVEALQLIAGDPRTATLDAATVSGLVVRARRPGDRFRPLGLRGRKKLQDFFVDRKVPREERDRTPIVVDGQGRIVWVAGHGIAEDFRVSHGTHDVVILKLRGERV
jgi:tRNA(Ile)-lysidine synthase